MLFLNIPPPRTVKNRERHPLYTLLVQHSCGNETIYYCFYTYFTLCSRELCPRKVLCKQKQRLSALFKKQSHWPFFFIIVTKNPLSPSRKIIVSKFFQTARVLTPPHWLLEN